MTFIRIQVAKPTGQVVRASQFARARAQRPSPTALNYCTPRSACGPSRSACGPSRSDCGPSRRSRYSKTCEPCAPCGDPMDPFGIMPMLNNMARMSTADCRPTRTRGGYASYTVPRNIPVDVVEKAECFDISADIPGVQKDQIKLIVDQDTLIIEVAATKTTDSTSSSASTSTSAKTTPAATTSASTTSTVVEQDSSDEEEEEEDMSDQVIGGWTERPKGFARRTLRLPKSADLSTVTAAYENGVLTLYVDKKLQSRQQRITIQ